MASKNPALLDFDALGLDPVLTNTLNCLRSVFCVSRKAQHTVALSTTHLHDLTCFTLHRLLSLPPLTRPDSLSTNTSECLRYGVSLYLFVIHGPTYYSHARILNNLVIQLKQYLYPLLSSEECQNPLFIWLLSVGAVASIGTNESHWFSERIAAASIALGVRCWEDIEKHLRRVIWLETNPPILFQQTWDKFTISN